MNKIKREVHEADSSSIHVLSIRRVRHRFNPNELKQLNEPRTIEILEKSINFLPKYFITLEDKLRYLYTAYIQNRGSLNTDDDPETIYKNNIGYRILKLLKKLLPNTTFIEHSEASNALEALNKLFAEKYEEYFVGDDGRIYYDGQGHGDNINQLLDRDTLLTLLFDGIIVNYSKELDMDQRDVVERELKGMSVFYISCTD